MIRKEFVSEDRIRVVFELDASPWTERVSLVGEFNDWDTSATPMRRKDSELRWVATVVLTSGECYRFRYLVDGSEWLNDWHADDHVENPHSSYDSVIDLTK
jgi:1,4-alpha-glucan branching enzyme